MPPLQAPRLVQTHRLKAPTFDISPSVPNPVPMRICDSAGSISRNCETVLCKPCPIKQCVPSSLTHGFAPVNAQMSLLFDPPTPQTYQPRPLRTSRPSLPFLSPLTFPPLALAKNAQRTRVWDHKNQRLKNAYFSNFRRDFLKHPTGRSWPP